MMNSTQYPLIRFPTERFDHSCPEVGMGTLFMIKAISRKAYHCSQPGGLCQVEGGARGSTTPAVRRASALVSRRTTAATCPWRPFPLLRITSDKWELSEV